jgi:hypothetical protein
MDVKLTKAIWQLNMPRADSQNTEGRGPLTIDVASDRVATRTLCQPFRLLEKDFCGVDAMNFDFR